jgi:MFS family permease
LLAAFAVTFLLFMAGYGQLEAGVPAVLVAKAGMNAGDISKIFVTDTIFAVVAQVTLMGVVKKLSHRTSLAFAALSWSVFWALIFAVTKMHNAAVELTLVCVGAAIASTGAAFFSAVVPTLIHAAADDAERGRANALYGVSISVGYTLGPAAAGVFTGHGMAETFVFAAIGLTLVVGLLAAVLRFEAADASDAVTEHAEVGWSPEPEAIDR